MAVKTLADLELLKNNKQCGMRIPLLTSQHKQKKALTASAAAGMLKPKNAIFSMKRGPSMAVHHQIIQDDGSSTKQHTTQRKAKLREQPAYCMQVYVHA